VAVLPRWCARASPDLDGQRRSCVIRCAAAFVTVETYSGRLSPGALAPDALFARIARRRRLLCLDLRSAKRVPQPHKIGPTRSAQAVMTVSVKEPGTPLWRRCRRSVLEELAGMMSPAGAPLSRIADSQCVG